MKREARPRATREGGFMIFMFLLMVVVLITSVAYAVDVGRARDEQRSIQIAADAASLAAVDALGDDVQYSTILSVVDSLANANAVTQSEINEVQPRCGVWADGAFSAHSQSVCDSTANAVEVTIKRLVPASFGRFLSQSGLNLSARALSYKPPPISGTCIRPFGIENSTLSSMNLVEGDTLTLSSNQASGNWGKLDPYGNASSGPVYTNYMLNNVCHESIAAGSEVTTGTGGAEVHDIFETILEDVTPPYAAHNMVVAATSDFVQGNSTVQIQGFIKLDLLTHSGNGGNWQATFRVVDLHAEPDGEVIPVRQLIQ